MPRRKRTRLEDLPEEILVDQILVRLTPKAAGRCRVVSKSWLSATSTPGFMLQHHRRQPSLPIIHKDSRPATFNIFRGAKAASNKHLWSFLIGSKNLHDYKLQAACDGFLIVRRTSEAETQFYIYNPVTRKHALLPQVREGFSNTIIGFYHHHPTGEYRVLWVSRSRELSESSLYVVTVGSDEPRYIRVTMPAVLSPSLEHKLLSTLCLWYDYFPPVHHCGSLHWYPHYANDITGGSEDIIVFDTEVESFRWMRSPTKPEGSSWKLFNLNGKLAFWNNSAPSSTAMDVWVMQDYKAEIWAFKYRIDVSTLEASRQLYSTSVKDKKKTPLGSAVQCFNDMVVLNERELLMRFNHAHVLRCDIDGKFLGLVTLGES